MTKEKLVDVAGNTIEPGDWVVYPQMSGRSVQIVLGKLLSYNGKTAKIERIQGGRWEPGWRPTHHRDKRTGKDINVWSDSMKHWEKEPRTYYRHAETGEEMGYDEWRQSRQFLIAYGRWEQQHERGVLKDYVEEYKPELRPVIIQNVKNIVKVVPAEREDEQ